MLSNEILKKYQHTPLPPPSKLHHKEKWSFRYFNDTCCLDDILNYLLKTNLVNFTHLGEEPWSENNHFYFGARTFPVGTQEQIPLFLLCVDLRCVWERFLLCLLWYHRSLLTWLYGSCYLKYVFLVHVFFSPIKSNLWASACYIYLTADFYRNAQESIALKINVMDCMMHFLIDSLAMLPTIILKPLHNVRWAKCVL